MFAFFSSCQGQSYGPGQGHVNNSDLIFYVSCAKIFNCVWFVWFEDKVCHLLPSHMHLIILNKVKLICVVFSSQFSSTCQ